MNKKNELELNTEILADRIHFIRGEKVMLDFDLARLYETETRVLKQAVRRNINRFPNDFMFQLNKKEVEILLSQSVIPKIQVLGGSNPFAFTEQGVAMLSSVLKSEKAIEVNIAIMRTFVQLRRLMSMHKELSEKIEKLESKYDNQIKTIFDIIKKLVVQEQKPKKRIGFITDDNE